MAAALVGSVGAASSGVSGAAVSPAWGASETRALNNLLVLWVAGSNTATLPAAPAGWTSVRHVGVSTTGSASLFAKIATGGDAAPTVAIVASTVLSAQLAEFSGLDLVVTGDQNGSNTGTTSPVTATANNPGGGDVAAGELVVYAGLAHTTNSPAMGSIVATLNNGATAHDTTNAGTSTLGHFNFGYGFTASKGSDTYTLTFSGGTITSPTTALVLASFKQAGRSASLLHNRPAFRGRPSSWGRFMVAFPKLWTPRLWLPAGAEA